ncbi:uncharacterized protein LOC108196733 isoform X1 [Daucus carota subsp. sativus]|uniref:uncharacterized protein LOC108196733 isoform X1 n=1 Tax=Daucus carota subsp. sativus TaxID=79200 RepID=UPI0007F02153|nr:PREDICTED: uncharacterized protein LOC108196733 isoform X1 [Daucus carota subsp. sativus]
MEVDTFSDDNDDLPEKKPKRKVKTPAQIGGLERLYEEHKYPSESLKMQLAESLGLTEKQVSGWFCHRRLKDKKLKDDPNAYGKQDRSSGVIQDRGSGLKQDSCGSTKQGEQRHSEPREVESKRFTGEKVPGSQDITCEPVSDQIQNDSGTDDTSSGSSFPLQNNYFSRSTEPRGMVTSIDVSRKGNSKAVAVEGLKVRTKPSGYLKVKVQAEHVAITSVKRQLGRHYKEDGPPLGIEFDPLPPGAFESPIRDAVEEPGLVCESIPFSSRNSMTCKQRHPGRGYGDYLSRASSRNSDLDMTSMQVMQKSNSRENYLDLHGEKKPTFSYDRNSAGKMYSSMEMNEDFAREAVRDIRDGKEMRTTHHGRINEFDFNRRMKESASNDRVPMYGKRLDRRQREPSDFGDVGEKFTLTKSSESRPSNFPVKHNDFFPLEERKASRQAIKETDAYGKKRQFDAYYDPVEVSAFPANEIRPANKRSREDLPKQGYAAKPLMNVVPPWNAPRRSLAEVPSSFSEDETGETSTSGDEQ